VAREEAIAAVKLITVLSLVLFGCSPPTLNTLLAEKDNADTVYHYTGGTFTSVTGVYLRENRIQCDFTLSYNFQPKLQIGSQESNQGVTQWQCSDGHQTLTDENSVLATFKVGFSPQTGVALQPVALDSWWEFEVRSESGRIYSFEREGDWQVIAQLNGSIAEIYSNWQLPQATKPGTPGKWTMERKET